MSELYAVSSLPKYLASIPEFSLNKVELSGVTTSINSDVEFLNFVDVPGLFAICLYFRKSRAVAYWRGSYDEVGPYFISEGDYERHANGFVTITEDLEVSVLGSVLFRLIPHVGKLNVYTRLIDTPEFLRDKIAYEHFRPSV